MFQFRRFPTYTYEFSICYMDMTPCGFPHSDIPGSRLVCSSPRLFATYHVLLRLLVPRHSPCALFRLTFLCESYSLLLFPQLHLKVFSFLMLLFSPEIRPPVKTYSCFSFCSLYSVLKVQFFACASFTYFRKWWAQVDSNHRPRAYQARALTT